MLEIIGFQMVGLEKKHCTIKIVFFFGTFIQNARLVGFLGKRNFFGGVTNFFWIFEENLTFQKLPHFAVYIKDLIIFIKNVVHKSLYG